MPCLKCTFIVIQLADLESISLDYIYVFIRCTGQVPAGPVHTNSVKIIKCGTMETEIIKTNVYVTNNNKSEDFRPRY